MSGIINELIIKAKQGDNIAISELMNQYNSELFNLAKMYSSSDSDAEDALQNTYIRAFRNLSSLEDINKFDSWIKQITVNEAKRIVLSSYNQKNTMFSELDNEEEDLNYDPEDEKIENQPEMAYDKKETSEIVLNILDSLSEDQRIVALMHFYENKTLREIAEELEIPQSTVIGRIQTAKKNIKASVLEMERKDGIKLYNMAPLPFFIYLLHLAHGMPIPASIHGLPRITGNEPQDVLTPKGGPTETLTPKGGPSDVLKPTSDVLTPKGSPDVLTPKGGLDSTIVQPQRRFDPMTGKPLGEVSQHNFDPSTGRPIGESVPARPVVNRIPEITNTIVTVHKTSALKTILSLLLKIAIVLSVVGFGVFGGSLISDYFKYRTSSGQTGSGQTGSDQTDKEVETLRNELIESGLWAIEPIYIFDDIDSPMHNSTILLDNADSMIGAGRYREGIYLNIEKYSLDNDEEFIGQKQNKQYLIDSKGNTLDTSDQGFVETLKRFVDDKAFIISGNNVLKKELHYYKKALNKRENHDPYDYSNNGNEYFPSHLVGIQGFAMDDEANTYLITTGDEIELKNSNCIFPVSSIREKLIQDGVIEEGVSYVIWSDPRYIEHNFYDNVPSDKVDMLERLSPSYLVGGFIYESNNQKTKLSIPNHLILDTVSNDTLLLHDQIESRATDYQFYDIYGNLIASGFEDAYGFTEGYAAVKKDGKWGYIDKSGNLVIDYIFNKALPIYDGESWVIYKGRTGKLKTRDICKADYGKELVPEFESQDIFKDIGQVDEIMLAPRLIFEIYDSAEGYYSTRYSGYAQSKKYTYDSMDAASNSPTLIDSINHMEYGRIICEYGKNGELLKAIECDFMDGTSHIVISYQNEYQYIYEKPYSSYIPEITE